MNLVTIMPAQNVSTRQNGLRLETRCRDLWYWDDTQGTQVLDQDNTEMLSTLPETRH